MTDFLLVPGAGQGAVAWGQVWGYLTAPLEHPPPLRTAPKVGRVYALDFPGGDGASSASSRGITLPDAAGAIARAVEEQGLSDMIAVGHSAGASILLAALAQMPAPPKRVIMLSGIVPHEGGTIMGALPLTQNLALRVADIMHRLTGRGLRAPRHLIYRHLCNGMDPMEVVRYISSFRPLPLRLFRGRVSFKEPGQDTRFTYVVLERDRLISPQLQRRMARRLPQAELLSLDTCHQAIWERPREVAELLLRYA